jgi:hypothetical protein
VKVLASLAVIAVVALLSLAVVALAHEKQRSTCEQAAQAAIVRANMTLITDGEVLSASQIHSVVTATCQ